jgi:hypothetical protein
MPQIPEKCKLFHGPYQPPPLSRGDRATCHLRGAVKITSWTDARISWPRCLTRGHRGGSGVLLDDELARAVKQESAAAICFWWGVHDGVVWRWRKALGVTRTNNPGTHRLIQASAKAGAEAIKAKDWTDEECDARSESAKRLNLARHLRTRYHGPRWTPEQLAMLGTMLDADVARLTGRTPDAVRCCRQKLGIGNPSSPVWTEEELALLGTMPDEVVAARTGRTA